MESKGVKTIQRFLSILKNEKEEIGSIYFYSILSGLVQLSIPVGIQSIIGFVMAGRISTSLVLLIIFVIAAVFFSGLLQVNQMRIVEKIQQQLFVRYSFSYAHIIPNLDLREVNKYYLPELVNRFFDTVALQKGISKLLLDTPVATIQIIFGLVLLSFYHPIFIVFGLLLLVVLYLILSSTGKRAMETSIEESDYKYKVAGYLEELARVITTFKFSRNTSLHLKKTDEYVTGYLTSRTEHFGILVFQYWILVAFKVLITALLLIVGAILLVNQQLNIGQFIAAEIVILMVIGSVEKLIVNLDNVYDVFTSLEKVTKLTDKPVESVGTQEIVNNGEGLSVELNKIGFAYDDRAVLQNINLTVQSGEKLALAGPSASGKSTLLRLCSGVLSGYTGEIYINGNNIKVYKTESLRSRMGIMLSVQEIFKGTLLENISLGNESITNTQIEQLADIVGLRDFLRQHSSGLLMELQPAGQHLPGRIIKKILLLRALVLQPQLLLLEEPLDGIEQKYRAGIINYLFGQLQSTTVIIITNDAELQGCCNRVVTLADGVIANELKH
jgi:ABC-type bacteriocin/lantibiotic exporter with double-glycine peptidase domain